jgi:hypothetical protein
MNGKDLVEEVQLYVNLGYESPQEITDAVLKARGSSGVLSHIDPQWALRVMANDALRTRREAADRARRQVEMEDFRRENGGKSESSIKRQERRERKEMWARHCEGLGLSPDASPWEAMSASLDRFRREILEEALDEFLSNPLVSHFVPSEEGGGEWKKRGKLTADDCEQISRGYTIRATSEMREAAFFDQLAAKMREDGVKSVSDLIGKIAAKEVKAA